MSVNRSMILTLLVAPLLAVPLAAKPVELKDLTQELIRGRVKEYLAHPESAQLRAGLTSVALRDDQLFYQSAGGVPVKLEWRYGTMPNYDRAKEAQTQAAIRELLHEVLVKFEGGLLSEANAQQVLARTTFVPVPQPGVLPPGVAPRMPPPLPGAPARAPVAVYNPWRLVVYPWVAAAPMRCYHWWQYPWYAAPWYAYPWNTYWAISYYPTPWGFWYLPPANYYYWPPLNTYPVQLIAQVERRTEPVIGDRSAESLYLEGYDRYFDGDAKGARRLLSAAAGREANDARTWYIKALAERQLGDEGAALESARRGAALEMLNGATKPLIAQSLERVQGDTRRYLRAAGADLTVAKAQEIVASPVRLATAK